jgi:hypothetical protein
MSCLDVDTAVAYLAGELDQLDADRCAAHVAECASCRDLLRDASALIDEVRQDLLVLDGALEDTAPPPIEDIFTRARRSIAVVDFAEIDVPAAPAAVTAPADERVVTERRTTRNTLLTAAAAIVVVLLLPSGTWAWVAATVRGAFDRAFGSSQDAPSDLRVGPTTSGGDVSLPPPTRTPPAVVKRPKAESPVRLSHSQSAMLEMDVLARLDTVGALLQGQVTVSRTDAGVEVRGLVEDVQTQRAVAEALAPLSRAPVSVKVQTVSEALRQMPPPAAPSIRYQPLE